MAQVAKGVILGFMQGVPDNLPPEIGRSHSLISGYPFLTIKLYQGHW